MDYFSKYCNYDPNFLIETKICVLGVQETFLIIFYLHGYVIRRNKKQLKLDIIITILAYKKKYFEIWSNTIKYQLLLL